MTSKNSWKGLSPFTVGPCEIPGMGQARIMENAWQMSKVYSQYASTTGEPTDGYFAWAKKGFEDTVPHRYPMGRGKAPLYSLWNGKKLGYIDARKEIYLPLFRDAVKVTEDFKKLQDLVATGELIALWDYDGYDHEARGMSLKDVLNEPRLKMGHAFVLKMMLTLGPDFTEADLK